MSDAKMQAALQQEREKFEAAQKEEMDRLKDDAKKAREEAGLLRDASSDGGKSVSEIAELRR